MISFFLIIMLVINITGQTFENLSSPLWYSRIDDCPDAFIMFQIMIIWYPIMFLITALIHNWYSESDLGIFRYTWNEHWWICSVGFFDALNGALVIPASPADKTPPIITALLSGSLIIPMVVIKHFYMNRYSNDQYTWDQYKKWSFYLCLLFTILSTYMMVYPPVYNHTDMNTKLYWWIIFFIGMIFGNFYNVQQELFFKEKNHNTINQYFNYLFWETFYLLIWGYIFTPLNLIPKYGYATPETISCNYKSTFRDSFLRGDTFGYNFMFNIGYYMAYIASCYINTQDALIGTVSGIITNAVVIIISYPIDELTPDKSVVQIGLLPMSFILGTAATLAYTKWSTDRVIVQTGIQDDGYKTLISDPTAETHRR